MINWDTWFCPNRFCTAPVWLVQRCDTHQHGWRLAQRLNARAWTSTAPVPACPHCGTTLITPIDLVVGRADRCDVVVNRRARSEAAW